MYTADCSIALQDPNCAECGFDNRGMPICTECKPGLGYTVKDGICEKDGMYCESSPCMMSRIIITATDSSFKPEPCV